MNEQCIREEVIEAMKTINNDRCRGHARFNYPHHTRDQEYRMPMSHWEPALPNPDKPGQSDRMNFRTHPGVNPSEAIDILFDGPDCPILVECLCATYIVYYRALIACVGREMFDRMFFEGIQIAPNRSPIQKYFRVECRNNPAELQRGDWVYFYNHPNYLRRHANTKGNAWQGENALVVDFDRYEGFGVSARSEELLVRDLFEEYNRKPNRFDAAAGDYVYDGANDQAYPPLRDIREIPGLTAPRGSCKGRIGPVIIPDMDALP